MDKKLKIAICFSGQIRTGVECSDRVLKFINNHSFDIDIFVHTWDIETMSLWEPSYNDNIIPDEPFPVDYYKIIKFKEIYNPKIITISNFKEYQKNIKNQYGFTTRKNHFLYQSLYECNRIKMEYEKENNMTYDYVIKMRPDCVYYENDSLITELIYINTTNHRYPYKVDYNEVYVNDSWNKIPIKMEDVFWVSKSHTMNKICNFINYYYDLSVHDPDPQIDVYNYVTKKLNIYVKPLMYNNFKIYRQNDPTKNNPLNFIGL